MRVIHSRSLILAGGQNILTISSRACCGKLVNQVLMSHFCLFLERLSNMPVRISDLTGNNDGCDALCAVGHRVGESHRVGIDKFFLQHGASFGGSV